MQPTDPEKLNSWELIYTTIPTSNILMDMAIYYNNVEAIGWSKDNSTNPIGELNLIGLEGSVRYQSSKINLGVNHSFTHMLDWEMKKGITTNGISYADYNYSVTYKDDDGEKQELLLTGNGKNINNWSNNATKFFLNYHPLSKWNFHVDAQIFYGFEGLQDGLDMLTKAFTNVSNAEEHKAELKTLMDRVASEDVYDIQSRVNTSISYNLDKR